MSSFLYKKIWHGISIHTRKCIPIVSWVTKSERAVRIKDIAVTLAVAAVCSIYLIRNLSMINVIVPELAMFLAIALFAVGLNKN